MLCRPRHPPAKLGNASAIHSSSAVSAVLTPSSTPHRSSIQSQGSQQLQQQQPLQLLPQAYYTDSPAASPDTTRRPDADPFVDSPVQSAQDMNGSAAHDSSVKQGLFDSPEKASAGSLPEQLQPKGASAARGHLAASSFVTRPSSPNPFPPHAHKPVITTTVRTPSRFGRGQSQFCLHEQGKLENCHVETVLAIMYAAGFCGSGNVPCCDISAAIAYYMAGVGRWLCLNSTAVDLHMLVMFC